ncbi:unnamed protein product [Auanema sp. JU1783]|nr:unnamed protein product [Auanema sp. JU1783]
MCSSTAKNETNGIDEEISIPKTKCYEGYCKKEEFCIEAGIGALCLSSTLTTTPQPTTTTTTTTVESAEAVMPAERESKPISKCQNMKCAHGGMCFEIFGEARCFASPICRNVLERWYDCVPCESECSNRTIIQKTCQEGCRPGCACRPHFIREKDGSCTLPIVCLNDFKPLPIINLEPLVVVDTRMDRNRKNTLPSISSSSSSSSSSEETEDEGARPYE